MDALKAAADEILETGERLIVQVWRDVNTVFHEKRDIVTRIATLTENKKATP